MTSIFAAAKKPCNGNAVAVAEAVRVALGKNCQVTAPAAGSAYRRWLRAMIPYSPNKFLAESFITRMAVPQISSLSAPDQLSIIQPADVMVSGFDLLRNPVPIPYEGQIGPDAWVPQDVNFTAGVAAVQNFPFISVPQYRGTVQTPRAAAFVAVPLFGKLLMINFSENDIQSTLEFTNRTANGAVARVLPTDNDCRQLLVFLPFFSTTFEAPSADGSTRLSCYPEEYIGMFNIGDPAPASVGSINPWTLTIKEAGATKTSGYSWNVQEIPVPLSEELLQFFIPEWTGSNFTRLLTFK